MSNYTYFTAKEFQRLSPPCDISLMNPDFMNKLDNARHLSGFPFVLSSAFRSREWDLAKGRSGNSWHCSGNAVDIICRDSEKRFKIVQNLIRSGLKGIIVYPSWIHVDYRPNYYFNISNV